MTPKATDKSSLPLAAQVRITVPSTIAQLVKFYNQCDTPVLRRECETACRDVLDRLEHLVLISTIPDPLRRDFIRSRKGRQQQEQKSHKLAGLGRISVLMLARCRSKHIRDRSMELLVEALDTNELSVSEEEANHLQMLWVELVQMLRHIIDAKRSSQGTVQLQPGPTRRMSQVPKTFYTMEENIDQMVNLALDRRVPIEAHLESILMALSLTLQRMEYISDTKKARRSPSYRLLQESYAAVLEDLPLLRADDPQMMQLVKFIQNAPLTSTEQEKLHIGNKFIQVLATAAMKDQDAFMMFLEFTKGLSEHHWEWQYLAVLRLGAISCVSESSSIRRQALELGLMQFCQQSDNQADATPESGAQQAWMIRAAAIVGLIEVYQQYHNSPFGLLAREMISSRKQHEKHPYVSQLLECPAANIPQVYYTRQLQFLPKYCCMSVAEMYSDSQSDYLYLRKYVETSEKQLSKLAQRNKLDFSVLGKKHHSTRPRSARQPDTLSTRKPRLDHLGQLSLDPYHDNYKKVILGPGDKLDTKVNEYFDQFEKKPLPEGLKPSTLSEKHQLHQKPDLPNGTANRRKLFNAILL
ncbi:hypothetical protein EDD86DRAFT_255376 [Gorgonomyces haynaldii]|nr:hypothetical protein EDD86DRAFT_255376 [Gorgonomyces haynaldii]